MGRAADTMETGQQRTKAAAPPFAQTCAASRRPGFSNASASLARLRQRLSALEVTKNVSSAAAQEPAAEPDDRPDDGRRDRAAPGQRPRGIRGQGRQQTAKKNGKAICAVSRAASKRSAAGNIADCRGCNSARGFHPWRDADAGGLHRFQSARILAGR